jgi:hypothetical protein
MGSERTPYCEVKARENASDFDQKNTSSQFADQPRENTYESNGVCRNSNQATPGIKKFNETKVPTSLYLKQFCAAIFIANK